jgi:hypothetical protein
MEYKIIDNQRYVWISHKKFLKDIPIIFNANNITSSKRRVLQKLKLYEDLGLIVRKTEFFKFNTIDNKNEKGTYSYFCLTEKFDYLTEYEKNTQNTQEKEGCEKKFVEGTNENSQGVRMKIRNKDNSIIDYPTIDNSSSSDAENNKKNDDDVIKPDLEFSEKNSTEEIEIKERIEKKIGEIQQSGFKKLLKYSDLETITYYLDNWKKFDGINMTSEVGFFIDACIKKYPFPKSKKGMVNNQPIQATNYEQREYDDEFYDSLYNNLEYIK